MEFICLKDSYFVNAVRKKELIKMKCKQCGCKVRSNKTDYNDRQKMCAKCYKHWKKIGRNLKKYA